MMNKRNTEGYVLAYLLIVITVMGLIAATLMTSTLQVVTAQEKSLVYMQDKYEAMGEVETLIAGTDAKLAKFPPSVPSTQIAYYKESDFEDYSDALDASIALLKSIILSATTSNLNFPSDPDNPSESSKTFSSEAQFTYFASKNEISVSAKYKMAYSVTINQYIDPTSIVDPDELEEGQAPPPPDYDYSYTLVITSITPLSYEITSNGGAA